MVGAMWRSGRWWRNAAVGLLLLALAGVGLLLWWPPDAEPSRTSDLGGALLGGVSVAAAVVFLESAAAARADAAQIRLLLAVEHRVDGIHLDGRDLRNAYLARRLMENASMRKTDLRDAVLYRAVLAGADLDSADLRGADAGRIVLNGASLRKARLDGCDLGWSDLRGADLSTASGLRSAKLERATYDHQTRWPPSFEPFGAKAADAESSELDAGPEDYVFPGWSHRRP